MRASHATSTPRGVEFVFAGQFEQLEPTRERVGYLVPPTLVLVVLLLYAHLGNAIETMIVLATVPFSLVGSVWALYLDYHISTAVWVGVVALVGLASQTGVVMVMYLDQAYLRRVAEGKIKSLEDIEAHREGTVLRVRPKLMTVATALLGLVPLLFAEGLGANVMERIAAPMLGGLITSTFLTLEILPVIYTYWRHWELRRAQRDAARRDASHSDRDRANMKATMLRTSLLLCLFVNACGPSGSRIGQPLKLVFTRVSDAGCAQELLVPSLGVRVPLPLNQPVEIEVTPTADVRFSCGMDMLSGQVVVHRVRACRLITDRASRCAPPGRRPRGFIDRL